MSRRFAVKILLTRPRRTADYLDSKCNMEGKFEQDFAQSAVRLLAGFSRHFSPWAGDYAAVSSLFQFIIDNAKPGGTTYFPTLALFRTRDAQVKSVGRAIHSLGLVLPTFDPDLTRDALDAIYAVYLSFWLRKQAVKREMEIVKEAVDRDINDPPPELALELRPKRADAVVEQLQAIDNVVRYAYEIMMFRRGKKQLLVYCVSVLCVRIVSLQLEEQQDSGQSFEDFFKALKRPTSHMWLFFVLLGLTIFQNHLSTSKLQTLFMAEAATEPQMGVIAQGRFIRYLFGNKKVYGDEVRAQPHEVQVGIRPPQDIWEDFQTNCVCCGKEARKVCSACHGTRYCGQDCQIAHWNHSHRPACSIYNSLPRRIANSVG